MTRKAHRGSGPSGFFGRCRLSLRAALFLLSLVLPALVTPASAEAQEGGVEEETILFQEIPSVFGASKYEQRVSDAPASVTIITSDEIKRLGYRTLADILNSVRGFYVSNDRNYQYLGLRGFSRPGDYNTRFLLLIDGHRINDNVYTTASIGNEFPLDIDLIDRVEIIRGPSSSLYGSNAFFGVVNVITKRGRDLRTLEASGSVGGYGSLTGRMSYGNRFPNGIETLISGSYAASEGDTRLYYPEYDSPKTNDGIAEDADGERSWSSTLKLSYGDFLLEGSFTSRKKFIPTASWDTVFNDPGTYTIDERGFLFLKYEHTFGGDLDLMARLSYDEYRYQGDYVYNYGTPKKPFFVANKDDVRGRWWGGELQVTKTLLGKHKLILGGQYRDNIQQDQKNSDLDVYIDDQRQSREWGLFAQAAIVIADPLTLNAGIRYDHYSTFGGTTNPRLALIWNPLERTYLKLLYGTAFRAPNVYELYWDVPDYGQKGNPDLQPETISTYELVYEYYPLDSLRLSVLSYYYLIKDLISSRVDKGVSFFDNAEEIEAKGVELSLDGRLPNGIDARISSIFQRTKDKKTGALLTNSPKNLTKLNLAIPILQERLFGGVEVLYTGRRTTLSGDHVSSYTIVNVTLFSQNLIRGLEASATVYNLFDKKYSDPAADEHKQDSIEQDGMSFRVKLTYAF